MKKITRVFIVGEVMVETWNQVPHHAKLNSTVQIEKSFHFLGGMATNSAVALAGLGFKPNLVTNLGDNTLHFLSAITEGGILLEYSYKSHESASVVFAFFNQKGYHHYHLLAPEPKQKNPKLQKLLSEDIDAIFLLTGGHYKYFRELYLDIVKYKEKKKIIFSPSYALYSFTELEIEEIIRNTDILILNRLETEWFCNKLNTDIQGVVNLGPNIFISTQDINGCNIYIKDNSKSIHVPTIPAKIANSIGAGDAFNAGFVTGLLYEQEIEICAKLGNALAAICVSKPEIQVNVTLKDLIDLYKYYYGTIGETLLSE